MAVQVYCRRVNDYGSTYDEVVHYDTGDSFNVSDGVIEIKNMRGNTLAIYSLHHLVKVEVV